MKCCLNCAMCHQRDIKDWQNMDYEKFKKLLIKLKKQKVKKISLVGGEIFVHKEMWKFIELMEKMKFQYDISSNLFFVPGGVERFGNLKGLEIVTTSIDGIGKQHDEIRRVPKAFERTMENIEKIIKMKIPLDVACVIQKHNFLDLEKIVEFLCKKGVKSITLLIENNISKEEKKFNEDLIKKITEKNAQVLVGCGKNPLGKMEKEDWKKVFNKIQNIRNISKKHKCTLNLSYQLINPKVLNKNFPLKDYTCGVFKGYNNVIYNKGELPFCSFILIEGNHDLTKEKLLEAYNSKEYIKLREAFKKFGALPMCRMCCGLKKK
jgi:MoaA/NifB/PqqE/SkfB family radical SAM enzyme